MTTIWTTTIWGAAMKRPIVLGTGSFVPEGRVTSREYMEALKPRKPVEGKPFEEWPLVATDWVERHFGINTFAYDAKFPELTKLPKGGGGIYDGDLAVKSAQLALENAGITGKDVDVLVHVSCTPETNFFDDCMRQMVIELGIRHDIHMVHQNLGCAGLAWGFREAMLHASARVDDATVLVVASNCPSGYLSRETLDHYVDAQSYFQWSWLSPAVFGDGGGAIVFRRNGEEGRGLIDVWVETHPETTLIAFPAGGSLEHTKHENVVRQLFLMDPSAVREQFVALMLRNMQNLRQRWPIHIQPAVNKPFTTDLPVRWYLHQANRLAVVQAATAMKLPMDRVPPNIQDYGNTSAASTLLLFDADRRVGVVKPGDLVIFSWIGAGVGAMNGYAVIVV